MRRILLIVALVLSRDLGPPGVAQAEHLSDAWAAALSSNAQLDAAELDRDAAYGDLAAAQSAQLPWASVQSSYSLRSDERRFLIDNPLSPGQQFSAPYAQRDAPGAAALVKVPLYAGGRIQNSIRGAEARWAAAGHSSAMSRLDLLLAVSEAYIGVLRCQRELQAAEQNCSSLVAHQTEAQQFFAHQRVPRNDVLAAEVAAASAAQLCLQRRCELATARAGYNRLVGRMLDAEVDLLELQLPPLQRTLDEMQQLGWQQRPDLAQLHAASAAHAFEAERLRGTARPEVNAIGRFDYEENRFQSPQALGTAAVVMDWRLYDGGGSRRAAGAEQARAASIARLADDLRSTIALDVFTAWNSAQEAAARIDVAAGALERANENVRISRLRFSQGLAIGSEVLDAQAQLAQANRDYYNAAYDLCLAQVRLRYFAGILGSGE